MTMGFITWAPCEQCGCGCSPGISCKDEECKCFCCPLLQEEMNLQLENFMKSKYWKEYRNAI